MDILVTIDANYMHPLKVMLGSLFSSNPGERFRVHLVHAGIAEADLAGLASFIEGRGHELAAYRVGDEAFGDAPVLLHYTKAMYYRLLAFKVLPQDMDRVLYLDPDILVINPLRTLYDIDLSGFLYAAAYHSLIPAKEINKLRLLPYEIDSYYNSGVLLMNLALQRSLVDEREIFDFVERNRAKLIMPDQDIINALYAKRIKTLDEKLFNYDVRYYRYYRLATNGECDMDFVIGKTSILHFCGARKPWNKGYIGQFLALYKHYERLAGEIAR